VADNSYGAATVVKTLAAGETGPVLLDLQRSHGWYDFTVRSEGSGNAAHFGGRVETGRSSFTDPFMGRVQLT
jgi:phospholipase C